MLALSKGWFTLWTIKSDHGRGPFLMVWVHGPTSMVRLLRKLVLKALGPLLCVNQMWTKKNDHAPKSKCVDFFLNMPKKGSFEKKFKCEHLLSFLGASLVFICLHFSLNVSKMWLANLLTTILTKECTYDMYLVLSLHWIGYLVFV